MSALAPIGGDSSDADEEQRAAKDGGASAARLEVELDSDTAGTDNAFVAQGVAVGGEPVAMSSLHLVYESERRWLMENSRSAHERFLER